MVKVMRVTANLIFLSIAVLWPVCGAFAQQTAATTTPSPDKLEEWIKQNFPAQTAKPTDKDEAAQQDRFKESQDARQQLDVDMRLKHQSDTKWRYRSDDDRMGRGITRIAEVESTNFVSFRFPYENPQQARLVLVKRPTSKDVILKIERGQFATEWVVS